MQIIYIAFNVFICRWTLIFEERNLCMAKRKNAIELSVMVDVDQQSRHFYYAFIIYYSICSHALKSEQNIR